MLGVLLDGLENHVTVRLALEGPDCANSPPFARCVAQRRFYAGGCSGSWRKMQPAGPRSSHLRSMRSSSLSIRETSWAMLVRTSAVRTTVTYLPFSSLKYVAFPFDELLYVRNLCRRAESAINCA